MRCRNDLVVIAFDRLLVSVHLSQQSDSSIDVRRGSVAYVHRQSRTLPPSDSRCARSCSGNWRVEPVWQIRNWCIFGLALSRDETASSIPPAFSHVVFKILNGDLEANGDWDFSYIPPSAVINVRSSLLGDFLSSQQKCGDFSNHPLSNAGTVFWLEQRSSITH